MTLQLQQKFLLQPVLRSSTTNSQWKSVAFASHSMSNIVSVFADQEGSSHTTWACEKISDFILGKHFSLETDHKPFVYHH